MYFPNPHQVFYSGRGTDLGMKFSESPFPSAIQQTDGWIRQTLLIPRQFLSSSIRDFAASPVTLLWAVASVGCNRSGTCLVSGCVV